MKQWTQGWLSYSPKKDCGNNKFLKKISFQGFDKESVILQNAIKELEIGIAGMLSVKTEVTFEEQLETGIQIVKNNEIHSEGYNIEEKEGILTLQASDERGMLYGIYALLRQISMEKSLTDIKIAEQPGSPFRMYNHWDNMDGSIERGYSGKSFFFVKEEVVVNERTRDYCRLVASVGINAVVINNVNVVGPATYLITDRYLEKVKEMTDLFSGFGIKLFLSLNFAATIELGGPNSADPLDPEVIKWWEQKIGEVYAKIPNLGGFLVKADSEGRPGPFTYGRTQADGANMLADIIKPYGGIIIWRCFVYNCQQDWRDYKTDRARAAYDNFIKMDGDYHDNVILQIKNGPMDFQVREPISPLLGGLKKTNQMLEVQVAQEYTGHQIDVCYLIPMFKEILEFKTYCAKEHDTIADIISGRTLGNINTGFAAVINTGNDKNWTGNDLAGANFYGFGRLAYNMKLTAEEIAEEWIRQAFSNDTEVVEKVLKILMESRATYEKYTTPLGIGWMVTPHVHYGPSIDGYEYSRWGTYHRADHLGMGVDRSDKGTGYAQQYYEPNAAMYNSMETCPEELLLFFHHVPYTYTLKSGKTLIQHIYDTHFEGVEEVEAMMASWATLKGRVNEEIFTVVTERFNKQLANAKEWRDQVNTYFYRKSGIADEKERMIY
ncbi:MAG: alpha-glucuronidase [Lachnospiraceae bacterium]|nr:alpha-glucuronidase [Lachnospiraceae bacterium]